MFPEERRQWLVSRARTAGRLDVAAVSDELNVAVETIRRDLEKEFLGKRIKTVDVTGLRSIRRHASKKQFVSRLEGTKLESVGRRGKNLLVDLGEDLLVVHLGMSGQLLKAAPKDPTIKHTHVVITFTVGGQLRYVDARTFGELYVVGKQTQAEEAPDGVALLVVKKVDQQRMTDGRA